MNKQHSLKFKPQYAKLLLAFFLTVFSSHTLYAYDLEVDGIYYNVNEDLTSVTVTGGKWSGDVVIPSTIQVGNKTLNVTAIGAHAFRECSSITSIEISEGITSIGLCAFAFCKPIKSLSIPESMMIIDGSADEWGYPSFVDFHVEDLKFVNVESVCRIEYISSSLCSIADNVYIDGKLVTSIEIPEGVTSIGSYAFYGCSSLTSISIPESVTNIGKYAFRSCPSLISITVAENNPVYDSHEECNAIIETSSSTLIAGCQNTIIPNGVTSIGDGAFSGCSFLTSISIPEGVTSIGNSAFSDCSSLTSISIPEGVTSIGNSAFSDCSSLTSISIPEGVTSIGEYAFSYCYSLILVICHAENVPIIHSNTFRNDSFSSLLLSTLYVPASAVEAYKAADYWKDIENIFSIEEATTLSVGETGLASYCPFVNIDLNEAKDIAAYRATVENNIVILTRAYTINRGEGVLLRSLNGGAATETVYIATDPIKDEQNDFAGLLKEKVLFETDDEGNTNFVLSRQEDGSVGFYKADLIKLAAGKAYLPVANYSPSTAEAKGLRLVFDDGTATGIDIADAQQTEASGAYYTLSGVKVENPTANGIYIKDGKKYIIK